jgi:hypothetical protein
MLDRLNVDTRGDMAFAGFRPANQNNVFRVLYELAALQVLD